MLNYFQANSGEKLGTEVNLAKAMFVQNGYNITKKFIKAAEDYLNIKLVTVNFKSDGVHAKHIINQYVLITNHILWNTILSNSFSSICLVWIITV